MPCRAAIPLAIFALIALSQTAHAHAVGMECRIQGERLVVEAFYDDASPAVRARVRVLEGVREIANGLTDEKGMWSVAAPAPGLYRVTLDAGAGHRATSSLTVPPMSETSSALPEAIRQGPTRQEFTRFPWDRLLLGLLAIFGVAGAFLLAAAARKGFTNRRGPQTSD